MWVSIELSLRGFSFRFATGDVPRIAKDLMVYLRFLLDIPFCYDKEK
jgi:hypothetical protein